MMTLWLDPFVRDLTFSSPNYILQIANFVTKWGEAEYILPFLVCMGVIVWFKTPPLLRRKNTLTALIFLSVTIITTTIIVHLGKIFIGRARPKLFETMGAYHFNPLQIGYDYSSMPSGHTMLAGTIAFALAGLYPAYRYVFYGYAVAVALSRIMLTAHYLSDVTLALIISYICVFLWMDILFKNDKVISKFPILKKI